MARGTRSPQTGLIVELGFQGFQGSSGSEGLTGSQGPSGSGFQGAQGAQGVQGPGVGAQGYQGLQGAKGSQGYQGYQGAQGVQGSQGNQGSGVQGAKGDQGYQGSVGTGVQGSQGPVGLTGNQGRQGRQGPDGIAGASGTTGTTGLQGIQGPSGAGAQGAQGTIGTTGIQGPSGLGFQGAQGITGTTGVQGIQGPSGLGFQGAQGITGTTGLQGIQGPSGLGFQGATGFQGIQGSGFEGTTGATGSEGPTGAQGAYGPTGDQGFQGTTGDQGFQGIQGIQGTKGDQGFQGFQGSGYAGVTGATGLEGPTGAQGPTGIGIGLTSGGSTGQVLVKTTSIDYEIGWTTLAASGAIYQFGGTASFPGSGSTAALYIDTTTNDGWYWTGSAYKAISQYDADLTVSLSGGKTFGKYSTGQTIPATGKTPRAVIQLAIAEALEPTLTLTSSTTIAFNQTAISNVINFSYVINSLGATISSVSLQWRRGGAGAWTVLSTSTTTPSSYTHTLTDTNYNTSAFNYQYIVTDSSGGTKTNTLNITPASYSAPSVSLTAAGASLTSPETNSTRERGNISTNLSGTITRNSANVAMTSYTLQYSTNNSTWVDIGTSVALSGSSQAITPTNHNDTALFASTALYYRVKVIDAYQTYLSSFSTGGNSTITFLYLIFYGPSSAAPTTSANVRALGTRSFTSALSNPFNLLTGTTYNIFTVAMPATIAITSVVDLDALNADITTSYILSTFNVQDAYGTNVSYKVYTMTNATPYGTSHRHQTTRA